MFSLLFSNERYVHKSSRYIFGLNLTTVVLPFLEVPSVPDGR